MPPKGHSVGAMRHRLTVQTGSTTMDALGGQSGKTYTSQETVWGRVEPLVGTERGIVGQVQATQGYRVTLHYRTDIKTADRLAWGARTLEVLSAANDEGRGKLLVCDCAEVTT